MNHIVPFLGLLVMALGLGGLYRAMNSMLAEEKKRSVSPFTEKLLRPPGESLRLRIDEIRIKMMDKGLVLAITLVIPGLMPILVRTSSIWISGVVWLTVAIVSYVIAFRKWRQIKLLRAELRGYQLGFDGERYVASELNPLCERGYRVFHDFVVDWKPGGETSNFNIDHVVVGPEGVFAIETKTRRKPLGDNGKQYKMSFDGKTLHFPGYSTTGSIEQATKNAITLEEWINGSDKGDIKVRPVLAIPGWYIDSGPDWRTSGVQRAKGLAENLPMLGRGRRLSATDVRRIGDRIEAHCRNVEGA